MIDKSYTLDLGPAGDILAAGPDKVRRCLLYLPGAETATGAGRPSIAVPPRRENYLAVEAAGSPTAVSDAYRQARDAAVRAPDDAVLEVALRLTSLSALGQPTSLLPHQWQFLAHAYSRTGVLNASEQGTGKTRPAWLLAHLWQARRVLIVCPKSLAAQWQAEFDAMWAVPPAVRIVNLADGPLDQRRAQLAGVDSPAEQPSAAVLVNYEALAALQPALAAWEPDVIVADESWRLKNPAAQVTKAALKLTDALHTRGGHVILCSGTPVANHVGDLYTQLRMADPALVEAARGAHGRFLQRYAEMARVNTRGFLELRPVGCADPAGLMRLVAPVWFRATKAACLELPPKRYRRVALPLPRATLTLYRQVARDGAAALGAPLCLDGEQTVMVHLQRLTSGFRPVPADEHGRRWQPEPLPCPKLQWLDEWAQDTLAGDPTHRALVWCRFTADVRRVQACLAERLGGHAVRSVTGETAAARLEEIKASFNSRAGKGVQVIVAQWSKLAYGHNLQACDTNVFFSHTWSYIERAQAEDRSHRHGRAAGVTYIELVAVDPEKKLATIDEQIMKAVEEKRDLAGRLTPETVARLAPKLALKSP